MTWKEVAREPSENISPQAIGERIKEERVRLKLGVGEFAFHAGVSDRSQRNYENGDRLPDAEYLARIQASTDADVDYILSGERAVYVSRADELEEQCDNVERVVLMLEGAMSARGLVLDGAQKAKCARWLYRAANYGTPVTEAVVEELLAMLHS